MFIKDIYVRENSSLVQNSLTLQYITMTSRIFPGAANSSTLPEIFRLCVGYDPSYGSMCHQIIAKLYAIQLLLDEGHARPRYIRTEKRNCFVIWSRIYHVFHRSNKSERTNDFCFIMILRPHERIESTMKPNGPQSRTTRGRPLLGNRLEIWR